MSNWTYVIGDWESYYSPKEKYSLRVMDPPSYILDPRFEEIGAAWKINGEKTFWIDGPDIGRFITSLGDLKKICFIAHNVLFDGGIASFRHGAVFGFYIDTLALSRALLGHVLPRHDLDSMANYLGVGRKGSTIHKVANMRRQDIINAGFYDEYAAYSCQDAELCWGSLLKLLPSMPASELHLNDMVHRMALEPQFKLDVPVLREHLLQVKLEKDQVLQAAGLDVSTPEMKAQSIGSLMSNDKFAEILQGMGVTPPTKISLQTQQVTWAFAKTDEGMKELLDHPDLAVQTITAARLGIKSTIEETRTERFINAAGLHYPAWGDNVFPVALKPSGAHTHRLSGDWKWNQQNLSRPSRKRPRAMLRESIVAPAGKSIVAGDEAQIELRVCAELCGQLDLLEELRLGGDPYSTQATKWFGYPVTRATVGERFCGKTGMLSCQFQVGWRKYQASVKHLSMEQAGVQIVLSNADAMRHVNIYRSDKHKISGMWPYLLNVVIPAMTNPSTDFMLGPVRIMFEKIVLPSGLCLHYRNLHRSALTGEWIFLYGNRIKRLYGGKLLENIVQALARIITMDVALRLKDVLAANYLARLALQAHDELAYVCPDECAPTVKLLLEQEMRKPPVWMPTIPLNCEVGIGKCYGKTKG